MAKDRKIADIDKLLSERKSKAGQNFTPDYVVHNKDDPRVVDSVLCKGCGGLIQRTVTVHASIENNVSRERIALSPNANYREIKFQMDDGGFHVTNACKTCANTTDLDVLNAWYAADLKEWIRDDPNGDGVPQEYIVRKVAKVVAVDVLVA